ncbi:hypothetical protein ACHAXR_007767 [Thalassiosira sp. AJA248-18]
MSVMMMGIIEEEEQRDGSIGVNSGSTNDPKIPAERLAKNKMADQGKASETIALSASNSLKYPTESNPPSLSALWDHSSLEPNTEQQYGMTMLRRSSRLIERKRNAYEAFGNNNITPSAIVASYSNARVVYRVEDPVEEERRHTCWSNAERCIFFDQYLHNPKNFKKISTFLKDKSTKDCIKYYYDSKMKAQYNQVVKEFRQWKRSRSDVVSLNATVSSMLHIGAIVKKDNFHTLPEIDASSHTESFPLLRLAVFDSLPISPAKDQTDGIGLTTASRRNANAGIELTRASRRNNRDKSKDKSSTKPSNHVSKPARRRMQRSKGRKSIEGKSKSNSLVLDNQFEDGGGFL